MIVRGRLRSGDYARRQCKPHTDSNFGPRLAVRELPRNLRVPLFSHRAERPRVAAFAQKGKFQEQIVRI
jgi:hypothetical protein